MDCCSTDAHGAHYAAQLLVDVVSAAIVAVVAVVAVVAAVAVVVVVVVAINIIIYGPLPFASTFRIIHNL